MRRSVEAVAGVVAVLTLLAACGGVTGTALPAPGAAGAVNTAVPPPDLTVPSPPVPPTTDDPDPTSEPGTSAAPSTAPGTEPLTTLDPVDVGIGRWLEARRIANQMASPFAVDPAYTLTIQPTGPVLDDFSLLLGSAQISALQGIGGVEAGFISGRTTDSAAAMIMMVVEFATPEQAALAAAQLPVAGEATPLTAGVEGAVVSRRERTETVAVEATLATGQLLQYVYLSTAKDVDGQPQAEQALTVLAASMAAFQITAPDARTALPDDRDALLAHTLGGFTEGRAGWYTAQGAMHFQYDYGRAAGTFQRAGVDLVVVGAMNVYRSADATSARLIQADFVSESASVGGYVEVQLDGLPASTICLGTGSGDEVYCVGIVDRYAFEFSWEDPVKAVELAQRQEKLLTQW